MRYLEALDNFKKAAEMHKDPLNVEKIQLGRTPMEELVKNKKAYNKFIFQKAKCKWLQKGDWNTSYFQKSIKLRHFHNRELAIQDMKGS